MTSRDLKRSRLWLHYA